MKDPWAQRPVKEITRSLQNAAASTAIAIARKSSSSDELNRSEDSEDGSRSRSGTGNSATGYEPPSDKAASIADHRKLDPNAV
jgi:hypothetical protein